MLSRSDLFDNGFYVLPLSANWLVHDDGILVIPICDADIQEAHWYIQTRPRGRHSIPEPLIPRTVPELLDLLEKAQRHANLFGGEPGLIWRGVAK